MGWRGRVGKFSTGFLLKGGPDLSFYVVFDKRKVRDSSFSFLQEEDKRLFVIKKYQRFP